MKRYQIRGSERKQFGGDDTGPATPSQMVEVTVALMPDRRSEHLAALVKAARKRGLTAKVGTHGAVLRGSAKRMQEVFDVRLRKCRTKEGTFHCRTGPVSVPEDFGSNVLAVMGLDNRPQAKPRFHARTTLEAREADGLADPVPTNGYDPRTLASFYGSLKNNAAYRSVGIIELGGAYQSTAMTWYFKLLGIRRKVPYVRTVGTQHSSQRNATIEVMLDSEIIATMVPNAKTVIYFYPNSTNGFYNAIARAVAAKHDAISISWGAPEAYWTPSAMEAYNNLAKTAAAQGTVITAASGDAGSSDGVEGVEVDFPAAAPYILACGGTSIAVDGGTYLSETVWNNKSGATGGGLSEHFPLPAWQAGVAAGRTMRLVPDVASVADPQTGFKIRVHGTTMAVGGTSAASPLWAAMICRLNRTLGRRIPNFHEVLYALPEGSLRPVTVGNNGAYQAQSVFDCCTGLGTIPTNLLGLLQCPT